MQIELRDGVLVARTGTVDAIKHLHAIRSLPYRRFVPAENAWHIDHVTENWEALAHAGYDLTGIPAPEQEGASVDATKSGKTLILRVAANKKNDSLFAGMPDTHSLRDGAWHVKPSRVNVAYIKKHWPNVEWTPRALEVVEQTEAPHVESKSEMSRLIEEASRTYKFGTQPYQHQLEAFALSRDAKAFGLLMEQGTGKTKVTIDKAGYLFVNGKIDAVLVLCPKSIKFVWENEVETHLPGYVKRRILTWDHKTRQEDIDALCRESDALSFFVMNIDAINTQRGHDSALSFLAKTRAMMVVDESSRIKQPAAKRTERCISLGEHAEYRQTLTGTPVTQGPLDVYSQFEFLDRNILGFNSFGKFRQHYAIMGGFNDRQVLKYVNMDELQALVQPYTFRVTKDECLDLPPKIYHKIEVELTKQQRAAYDEMRRQMIAEIESTTVTASIELTKLLRLHQITGGFYPSRKIDPDTGVVEGQLLVGDQLYGEIPGGNPKLEAMLEQLETRAGKGIIWCHFVPEIFMIERELKKRYGPRCCVLFHGGCDERQRMESITRFEGSVHGAHDPECQWFVGQSATGSMGLTLVRAEEEHYFSNSFSLETRLQSEDRPHRIGQTKHVNIFDYIARDTTDVKHVKILRKKLEFANIITGDSVRDWL